MALRQRYELDWDDIAVLFSSLNAARTKFQYESISYPESNAKDKTKTTNSVEKLVDGIEVMLGHDNIKEQAPDLTISDITIPQPKDKMKPDVFRQIKTKIDTVQGLNFGFNSNWNECYTGDCYIDDNCFTNSGWQFHSPYGGGSGCTWGGSATQSGTVAWG